MIFVYTNESQNTLVETLTFDITGLTIKGHENSNEVTVRVAPNETKNVQLVKDESGAFSFKMSIACKIE